MTDPVAVGTALIDRCHRELVAPLLPAGQPVWDVHAHLGEDDDGSVLDAALLTGEARRFGVEHTFVFPFRQKDLGAYREQNDAVIAQGTSERR